MTRKISVVAVIMMIFMIAASGCGGNKSMAIAPGGAGEDAAVNESSEESSDSEAAMEEEMIANGIGKDEVFGYHKWTETKKHMNADGIVKCTFVTEMQGDRIMSVASYDEYDVEYLKIPFEYDDQGRAVFSASIYGGSVDETSISVYRTEYDDSGREIRRDSYIKNPEDPMGDLLLSTVYIYTYNGDKCERKAYSVNDGIVKLEDKYCYETENYRIDENGKKVIDNDVDDYEYIYGDNEKLKEVYHDFGGKPWVHTVYSYDSKNNCIRKEDYQNEAFEYSNYEEIPLYSWIDYEYDEYDRRIKESYNRVSNSDSNYVDIFEYKDGWAESPEVGEWADSYYEFIIGGGYLSSGQQYNNPTDPNADPNCFDRFGLFDFENDGVPELVAFKGTSGEDTDFYIYRYEDEKVNYKATVPAWGSGIQYIITDGYRGLVDNYCDSGFERLYYYTIQDGTFRQDIIDRPEKALVEVVLMKSVKEIEEMGWNTFLSRIP